MRRSTTALMATGLVGALFIAAPGLAQRDEGESPQDIKSQEKSELIFDCPDSEGNQLIFHGDLKMWPPNHKYQDLDVTALDNDEDGEEISLTTRLTHDEYVEDFMPENEESEPGEEEQGAGNTQNDASPFFAFDTNMEGGNSVTNEHEVRSERSGRGDGRTYTIVADAMFDGEECSQTWEVEVPHDMRSHKAPAKQDKTGEDDGEEG